MKRKTIILAISLFLCGSIFAQNEVDALRYSGIFYGGTARSLSMAGSFGALGGDFSSLGINPAGIGVYRSSELTVTPTLLFTRASTNYLNNSTETQDYDFLANDLGLVMTRLTDKPGWVSWSVGIGYNRMNNFNRQFLIRGVQSAGSAGSSSLLDYMTDRANDAYYPDDFDPFYAGPAYDVNLLYLDTLADAFTNDIARDGYGQFQRRKVDESGGTGEYAFSFGANYGDKLYLGSTFGIHRMRFSQVINHTESDDNQVIDYFDSFNFSEYLDAYGTGYTFKMGMIYRPINLIRIGLAYHLPVFYHISEDYHTSMESFFDPGNQDLEGFTRSDQNSFDYKLRTPSRLIASVAVQLPKLATFNVDYELLNFASMNMDSRDYGFYDENDVINTLYTRASNIRAGGEVRLGPVYLRAGAGFYGSPFARAEENRDAYTMVYAGGLGLRGEGFFLDLGYTMRSVNESYYMYVLPDAAAADIGTNMTQFAATLGFRF